MGKGTAGHNADLQFSNDGGTTLVDVACDTISPSFDYDTEETTEFGDAGQAEILTIQRASIDISGTYRPGSGTDQDAGQKDIEDAFYNATEDSLQVVFYPLGNASGNIKLTFNCVVTSFNTEVDATGKVNFSATLENNDGGKITKGTV